MVDIFDTLARTLFSFGSLLILVRIVGNKQLGQMNVFTYISGIVVGSMVAEIIIQKDLNVISSMIGVAAWVGFAIIVEMISLKSVKARELLDGQPVILIKQGRIMYEALKKERLNLDDLFMMLRTNNAFSVSEVSYAILEPNGDLSVLKMQGKDSVTKEDMKIADTTQNQIPTAIIMDGKIVLSNLAELGLSQDWLDAALNKMGIKTATDILYAEHQRDGKLYAQLRNGEVCRE